MSTTDLGTQTVSIRYNEPFTTENYNKKDADIIKPGIYRGGLLSVSGTIVSIADFSAFFRCSAGQGIKVSTASPVTSDSTLPVSSTNPIVLSPASPYVVGSYTWANSASNYIDFSAKSSLYSTDVCFGKALYSGVVITGFDYTEKTWGYMDVDTGNIHANNITTNTFTQTNITAAGHVSMGSGTVTGNLTANTLTATTSVSTPTVTASSSVTSPVYHQNLWTSGVVYNIGDIVVAPMTTASGTIPVGTQYYVSYISQTNSNSSTNPVGDTTNWVPISKPRIVYTVGNNYNGVALTMTNIQNDGVVEFTYDVDSNGVNWIEMWISSPTNNYVALHGTAMVISGINAYGGSQAGSGGDSPGTCYLQGGTSGLRWDGVGSANARGLWGRFKVTQIPTWAYKY